MDSGVDQHPETDEGREAPVEAMPTEKKVEEPKDEKKKPEEPPKKSHPWKRWAIIGGILVGVALALYFLIPWAVTELNTISTDDAYVNGHVTLVAPRVPGQVSKVLVDNNQRVKRGDLLVQLDKVPYQVQVQIKEAAVKSADADLVAARAQVRSLLALGRSQRWQLQSAMDQVASQIANLRSNFATLRSKQATLDLARSNLKRGEELRPTGGISKEELDNRQQSVKVNEADVEQALQAVQATRVGLGLPSLSGKGPELAEVPKNLEQTFPGVRTALANLVQTMAQIGLPLASTNATPQEVLDDFRSRDASGDIDRIVEKLIPNSPGVKQAEARHLQAHRDLDQAKLNLQYCDIVSEIDGVVTGRNVNPGNNVQAGQSLMAVRSITEIWIDANFKETQLYHLRIGQRARCEVDMYGGKYSFEGRITGFTMGAGQTLSLLPPENATGNFVKIVQRLPVRIELTDYDPEVRPLFVGLSVTPYIYFREPPTGPNAGQYLQPFAILPQAPTDPNPDAQPVMPKPDAQPVIPKQ
jgi:membrane fusion protein (multidrug efflux system)